MIKRLSTNVVILMLLVFVCFYMGLGSYALENINEGLYAEIPREMLLRHDFIIPHLNFVPYLEKPPMLYWLIALSYKIFGISEFSARLIPATAGASVIFTVYRFMKRLQLVQAAFLSGLILVSSLIFVLLSRIIIFDMLLTAFITAALCNFYLWYEFDNKKYLRFAYVFVACAVMTKGLLAIVIPPGIAVVFMIINRTALKRYLQFLDPISILLFLAITLPWHIAASIQLHDFAYQYFVNEHWLRFLDLRFPRDYHTGPWYFYLPRLLVYLFPWSLFIPFIFRRSADNIQLISFFWTWVLIPLIFYSSSQAKGDYYMVLGVVPLAMLMAVKLTEFIEEQDYKVPLIVFTVLIMAVMAALTVLVIAPLYPTIGHILPKKLLLEPFIVKPALWLLLSLCAISLIGLLVVACSHQKITIIYCLFALLMIPTTLFIVVDKKHFQTRHSEKDLINKLIAMDDQRPVYMYKDYEDLSTVNFYLRRRVGMINSKSADLFYGSTTAKAKNWFVNFDNIHNSKKPVFVIMKPGNMLAFMDKFHVVAKLPNSVLLAN